MSLSEEVNLVLRVAGKILQQVRCWVGVLLKYIFFILGGGSPSEFRDSLFWGSKMPGQTDPHNFTYWLFLYALAAFAILYSANK